MKAVGLESSVHVVLQAHASDSENKARPVNRHPFILKLVMMICNGVYTSGRAFPFSVALASQLESSEGCESVEL